MENIDFVIEDNVGKILLKRPDVFNSFNRAMAFEVQEALKISEKDKEIRSIYISGTGKAFCAGQDLQEVVSENGPSLTKILTEHYNPIILKIREIEKPVICAVNGVAAGAGANIALACDITIAAHSASFIQAFSKIGLIPDSGGTYFLPRIIGRQKATALMMLGEKISAEEALEMGMIYKVFPDDEFQTEALAIAKKLATMPTIGLGLTKRALNYSLTNDLEKQLLIEDQLQSTAGLTKDYKEGVQAFLEKRKPNFKGE
jgi:2-(1,2-epoxy-1,2-dihydrophenyl)acetyl-CoA isomerase